MQRVSIKISLSREELTVLAPLVFSFFLFAIWELPFRNPSPDLDLIILCHKKPLFFFFTNIILGPAPDGGGKPPQSYSIGGIDLGPGV